MNKNQKQMLGETIYDLRKKRGLTQSELADLVGVSNKAVSKWETDEANPEISLIPTLAQVLGVSISELFGETQSSNSDEVKTVWRFGYEGIEINNDERYEFKSNKKTRKGIPIIHIHFGRKIGMRNQKAHGVIAIGNNAKGLIAIGLISRGLISIGLISIGLLALGLVSIGLLAIGSLSVAVAAIGFAAFGALLGIGFVATGMLAIGFLAIGYWSIGLLAIGRYAYAGESGRAIGEFIGPWWRR